MRTRRPRPRATVAMVAPIVPKVVSLPATAVSLTAVMVLLVLVLVVMLVLAVVMLVLAVIGFASHRWRNTPAPTQAVLMTTGMVALVTGIARSG